MGYMQDLERELKGLLQKGDAPAVIKFVKEKVLDSYKNGILAAKIVEAGEEIERKGKKFAR